MSSLKLSAVAVTAVLCISMHVLHGQQAPGQLGKCSQGLDGEMPNTCLQQNGVDYNGTLFIISDNRTGALPQGVTYLGFRDLMCNPNTQDKVVPCILQLMQKWNKTECADQDRGFMAARGGQFLALMEAFCNDPCEQAATQTLVQCFAAVQINPSPILSQNSSIVSDKFTFVGNDSNTATSFCNARQRLFTCLSPLASSCPSFIERLYTLGVDLSGLEGATKSQCDDVNSYVASRNCYEQDAAVVIKSCEDQNLALFRQVQEERFRLGQTPPSQFQGRLCQTKLTKVDCEVEKLKAISGCGEAAAEALTTFECTSLPAPCREGPESKPVYTALCTKAVTPSPATTQRPTAPPVPTGTTTDDGDGGNSGGGGDSGADVVATGSLRVVLLSLCLVLIAMIM